MWKIPSGLVIRRSQPGVRSGYYFLVRVKHPRVDLAGARFILHFIARDSPEPQEKTFDADAPPGEQLFDLGLTGGDWQMGRTATSWHGGSNWFRP